MRIKPETAELIKKLVYLTSMGKTLAGAAKEIGITERQARYVRECHPFLWRQEAKQLGVASNLPQYNEPKPPSEKAKAAIRQAALLRAAGLTRSETARAAGISVAYFRWLEERFPALWKQELDPALAATVVIVRRQAGTDAILEDPEAFLRRAMVADQWATAAGKELFDHGKTPTLCSFFESYYRKNRLFDRSPNTVSGYETALKKWRLLTGDPPLKKITVDTLSTFRDCLYKLAGAKPSSRFSDGSVRRILIHVQAVLDKAGPPGYRNRDAAGILKEIPPWIRRPTCEPKPVRLVTADELAAIYQAAVCMEEPAGLGFKPAAWWRALIVTVYATGIRKRTALELRMDEIDWEHHRLVLPKGRLKSKRAQVIHLNATALDHLRRIRTARELVFECSFSLNKFYKLWHVLLTESGIPKAKHFGLHDIRKTLATLLWDNSPQAAQLILGHADANITKNHYVERSSIEARALDAIPDPFKTST